MRNEDEFCFLHCVALSVLKINIHAERPSNYREFFTEQNTDGLKVPLPLYQIPKFERLNPEYSVNVFYLDDETSTIMPLKVTKCFERQYHVDMLLLAEDDKRHHVLIKNLAELFNDKSNQDHPCFPCRYCFRRCFTSEIPAKHIKDCKRHPPQVVLYPKPAVEGMAQIENGGSGDKFYNEYDNIIDQIELTKMRAEDRENGTTEGKTNFPEVSVNLNDGDSNRPYKFNPFRGCDVKKD